MDLLKEIQELNMQHDVVQNVSSTGALARVLSFFKEYFLKHA